MWNNKYENFAEFEKSADYKKWIEEKLKDAPIIKAVKREKTPLEKAVEQQEKEIQEVNEILEEMETPADMIQVQNEETGEMQYMTRQEWEEYNRQE